MNESNHKHLFPIVDAMLDYAAQEVAEEGDTITCRMGCNHCCHLLVEVSWEEAVELAHWVDAQPKERRARFISNIQESAKGARELFAKRKSSERYLKPYGGDKEIPDTVFDDYFYEKKRPCPFLELGRCAAYQVRPTPCRLHLVSSNPELCAPDCEDDEDYNIPEQIEAVKEKLDPMLEAIEPDGRWGQLAIIVEAALEELELIPSRDLPQPAAKAELREIAWFLKTGYQQLSTNPLNATASIIS